MPRARLRTGMRRTGLSGGGRRAVSPTLPPSSCCCASPQPAGCPSPPGDRCGPKEIVFIAHPNGTAICLFLGAVVLAQRDRPRSAAARLGLAVSTKVLAVLLVPFVLARVRLAEWAAMAGVPHAPQRSHPMKSRSRSAGNGPPGVSVRPGGWPHPRCGRCRSTTPLRLSSTHRLLIPQCGPYKALQAKDPPSRDQTELQAPVCWLVSCACREPAKAAGVELVLLQRTIVADEHVECQLLALRMILCIPRQESLGAISGAKPTIEHDRLMRHIGIRSAGASTDSQRSYDCVPSWPVFGTQICKCLPIS